MDLSMSITIMDGFIDHKHSDRRKNMFCTIKDVKFVPRIGESISIGEDGINETVQSIFYDYGRNEIHCSLKNCYCCGTPFEDIIKIFEYNGWH